MYHARSIASNQERAVARPVNRSEIILKLRTAHYHLVVLPQSNGEICTASSEGLLLRVNSAPP